MFWRLCELCGRSLQTKGSFCEDCKRPASPEEEATATRALARFTAVARVAFWLNLLCCFLWVVLGGLYAGEPSQALALAFTAVLQYWILRYFKDRMASVDAVAPGPSSVSPADPLQMRVDLDIATIVLSGIVLVFPIATVGRLVLTAT
jgi:hypothetical protein